MHTHQSIANKTELMARDGFRGKQQHKENLWV